MSSKLNEGYCADHAQSYVGECPDCFRENNPTGPVGMKTIVIPEGFMELVIEMRNLQKKFFSGDRSVVARAKKQEAVVDDFIKKILSDAGWTETEYRKRPPAVRQQGLF